MIRNVEYTNPFNGEKKILPVLVSDTETYANGFPIPDNAPVWGAVFENIEASGVSQIYTILP